MKTIEYRGLEYNLNEEQEKKYHEVNKSKETISAFFKIAAGVAVASSLLFGYGMYYDNKCDIAERELISNHPKEYDEYIIAKRNFKTIESLFGTNTNKVNDLNHISYIYLTAGDIPEIRKEEILNKRKKDYPLLPEEIKDKLNNLGKESSNVKKEVNGIYNNLKSEYLSKESVIKQKLDKTILTPLQAFSLGIGMFGYLFSAMECFVAGLLGFNYFNNKKQFFEKNFPELNS